MRMHLLDGVQVDHCDRHCGTFFDPGELKDAVHPVLDERIWNNDETVVSRRLSKLRSPVDEAWMESIVLDSKPPLTLDRCTNTGGIWLDDGECLKLYDFVLERGQNKDHTLSEERETRGIWSYLFQLFSQLPLEVWHPTRRRPLATYTVLFLIIAIFFLQYLETLTLGPPTRDSFGSSGSALISSNQGPSGSLLPMLFYTLTFPISSVMHLCSTSTATTLKILWAKTFS